MVLEGSLMVVGVSSELVDGSTIQETRRNSYSMPVDRLREVCATGWVGMLVLNTVLMIPTGFMTILAPVIAPCVGLRWSCNSDDACLGRSRI